MRDIVEVLEFSKIYNELNLELQKEQPYLYEFGLILINALELNRGYKVKKINKPTNLFTKVVYIGVDNADDMKHQHDLLNERLKNLLKEYKLDDIYKGVLERLGKEEVSSAFFKERG